MPQRMNKPEDFWKKVIKTETCWLWIGAISTTGYGWWTLNHIRGCVHKFAYEMLVGKIPEGLQIDHLCRSEKKARDGEDFAALAESSDAENTKGDSVINWPDFPQLWKNFSLYEDRWKFTYPGLEIEREILRMGEYLEANPSKKPKKNWKRFMVLWLARNQAALERAEAREIVQRMQRRADAV